jgi:predicted acetyltransferase
MSVEYRPAQDKEMREFYYSGRIGFGRSLAVDEVDRDLLDPLIHSEQTLCAFDGGVLAAKMLTLPLAIFWNGAVVECGGVTAVSTLPSHRRRGHVRELLRRSFVTMRDSGQTLSLLWASMSAIYQRFGFGLAFASRSCSFDARRLRFVDAIECPGRIDILAAGNAVSEVDDAYHRFAEQRTTALRRDGSWRERLTRQLIHPRGDAGGAPLLVAAYEEAGTILGYVVYGIERDGRGRPAPRSDRITVHELVWITPAAHRALIQYLGAYDLVESVWFRLLAADDPLFYEVEDPRMLGLGLSDGAMLRIVDLKPALEARVFDADGDVSFGIVDDLCPWNSGTWQLTVEGGRGQLRPFASTPELILLPRVLAMLATGFESASALARMGLIMSTNPQAVHRADRMFRTACPPICLDHF